LLAAAQVVLRARVELHLRIIGAPVGVDHQRTLGQKRSRYRNRAVQQAAGIVAQIEHQAFHAALIFLEQAHDRGGEILAGVLLELAHAEIGVARLEQLRLDTLDLDDGARQRHHDGFRLAFAHDGERDLRVRLAAHALDGVGQRHAFDRGVIELDDEVARLHARARSGRIVDRGDHLDEAFFHADFDAQPAKLALRADLQLPERFLIEVGRMRIETGQHAVDRLGDEPLVVDRFDVVAFHASEHLGERAQLLDRQGRETGVLLCDRGKIEADCDTHQDADHNQADVMQFVTHCVAPSPHS
jgi:hypothetical protein